MDSWIDNTSHGINFLSITIYITAILTLSFGICGGSICSGGRGGGGGGKEPGITGVPEIAVRMAANKICVGSEE